MPEYSLAGVPLFQTLTSIVRFEITKTVSHRFVLVSIHKPHCASALSRACLSSAFKRSQIWEVKLLRNHSF